MHKRRAHFQGVITVAKLIKNYKLTLVDNYSCIIQINIFTKTLPVSLGKKQLTSLPRSTFAVERPHPVDARGTIEARCARAVVDVHGALRAGPPVHTDTGEPTDGVSASRAVLAYERPVGGNGI